MTRWVTYEIDERLQLRDILALKMINTVDFDEYNKREIQHLLKFEDDQLTPEILKIARDELGETPDVRSKCLQMLKNKINNCKNFNARADDEFLIRFLRASKFDVTKAFVRLRKYYEQRQNTYSELFKKMYLNECQNVMQAKLQCFLPYRNIDGSAIVVAKRGQWDPSKVTLDELLLLDNLYLEAAIENKVTQVCGITVILDLSGLALSHILTVNLSLAYRLVTTIQDAFPCRFRTIHVVNTPRIFTLLYGLCKPLLSAKFRKRMIIYSSSETWESLHSYISPNLLPEEYGGNLGPFNCCKTHEFLNGMKDVLNAHVNSLFSVKT